MITLTWAKLNDYNFGSALKSLCQNSKLEQVTAYRVGRIFEVAVREMTKAQDLELELAKKHANKDENGEVVMDEAKRPKLEGPGRDNFTKELNEAMEKREVTIKVYKLDFRQLKDLNPTQLMAIVDICDNLPEEE